MANLMISFGTGGHSGEMLMLIKNSEIHKKLERKEIQKITCVISNDDELIDAKLDEVFEGKVKKIYLPRPRSIGQSYFSSIFTTIVGIFLSIKLIVTEKPNLFLTNGPALSLTLSIAIRMLQISTLNFIYKCHIMYIESFCRTKTLSLTGKILYNMRLASDFIVQWPKLKEKYPRSTYTGLLV